MPTWLFATDLHGSPPRYEALWQAIERERPQAVLLGGDLLPGLKAAAAIDPAHHDFIDDFLLRRFSELRVRMGADYPRVLCILGNDDARIFEPAMQAAAVTGAWEYIHERRVEIGATRVYGYGCIPPTPFLLKDWERYDVGRYVDPGCVSPEEGLRTIPVSEHEARFSTIAGDLERLVGRDPPGPDVWLFHAPPYDTRLDRAALDERRVDHVAVDVHVGSHAIRRLIESRCPRVTLHGHIHESPRLTGAWRDRIGATYCFSAAHDGPELALVRFDPADPAAADRLLI